MLCRIDESHGAGMLKFAKATRIEVIHAFRSSYSRFSVPSRTYPWPLLVILRNLFFARIVGAGGVDVWCSSALKTGIADSARDTVPIHLLLRVWTKRQRATPTRPKKRSVGLGNSNINLHSCAIPAQPAPRRLNPIISPPSHSERSILTALNTPCRSRYNLSTQLKFHNILCTLVVFTLCLPRLILIGSAALASVAVLVMLPSNTHRARSKHQHLHHIPHHRSRDPDKRLQ